MALAIFAPNTQIQAPAQFVVSREDEFSAFYNQHMGSLVRALTASLGNAELAQDAAQEAMARAYSKWSTLDTYENAAGWCYRVAMNWSTSRWRKRRREVLASGYDEQIPARTEEPQNELARIRAALMQLPLDQRQVVVLRLVEDWSIAQTAAALEIPDGTVQSRYSRALRQLRALLEADHG